MCPENVQFVSAEFREILEGVEEHGNVLVVEFSFVAVCNRCFDKIRVLQLALEPTEKRVDKRSRGWSTFALLASWRCLS
jgi:hypothetical protein